MSRQDLERVDYALANPWVFQYDFGHIELVRLYINSLAEIKRTNLY